MKKQISLLVLSLVLTLSFTVTATELKEAKVVSVIDGDTIKVRLKTGTTVVRYIGIDAPETHGEVERYGEEATNYNKNLVADKTVWLELGERERDQEDHLLAYVYLDKAKKSMVNAILLAQGYAKALTDSSSDSAASKKTVIYFFKMKGCPHCAEEEPFLEELQEKYPSLAVVDKEVSGNQENLELLKKMGQEYGREVGGVPATFIGKDVWVGFKKEREQQIEEKVKYCSKNHCVNPMVKLKGGNHKFADTFKELERDAKEDERGLWSKDSQENNE